MIRIPKTLVLLLPLSFLCILYIFGWEFLTILELKSMDLVVKNETASPQAPITIVAVDEKSLKEIGRWPWSRETLARLIDEINTAEPRVIGLDVFFPEEATPDAIAATGELEHVVRDFLGPDNPEVDNLIIALRETIENPATSSDDELLARAIGSHENVVTAYHFFTEADSRIPFYHTEKPLFARSFGVVRGMCPYPAAVTAGGILENISILAEASVDSGFINIRMDADGTVRRAPLAIYYREEYYPSFTLVIAKRYLGVPFEKLLLDQYGVSGVELDTQFIPTDDTGNLWIHYRGPGGSFPSLSAVDVLEGTADLSTITDGIVLVGATATGIGDLRVTPVSNVYPGVEIHATVIDNIIGGDMFTMPGWMAAVHLLIIIVLGLLTGLVLLRLGPFVGLVLTVSVLTGYFFGYRHLLLEEQLNIYFIYPAITLFAVFTSVTTSKYFAESQKKRYIHRAFSQYLSPAVIKELMDNPARLNLGGEERVLTAMFTDIAGFSHISENMTPEEIVKMLNEYFTVMTEIIFAFNGTVDKYEGDAIMAFFGAPIQNQHHAKETVRAAYYMQKRLEKLREKWERENSPLLHMRIGINTGPMVVGNLGSVQKMDYTVMGDAVNLAARLEPLNKLFGTKIIIGDETKREVENEFLTRELDYTRVPGRSAPVTIHEVVEEKGGADKETLERVSLFAEGRKLFLKREFVKAKELFVELLSRDETDMPCSVYIQRCDYFIEHPPDDTWRGIFDTLIK